MGFILHLGLLTYGLHFYVRLRLR